MSSSSGIRGRSVVTPGLTTRRDPESERDEQAEPGKFSRALASVAEREDQRRKRPRPGEETEDGSKAPAPGRPRPSLPDARQQALLQKVPVAARKPRSSLVPREVAEQKTDPRIPIPNFSNVETPPPEPLPDVFTDLTTDPLPLLTDDATVDLGDAVADDDVLEIDVDDAFADDDGWGNGTG